MLHLITTLLFLLHASSTTRAQLVFKRQVFGFDSSGRQLQANIDNTEDNSEEFLNQGTFCPFYCNMITLIGFDGRSG